MAKIKAAACDKLVSRHAKSMLEGIAFTNRTGNEYGFCAQGRKIVKRCRGKHCYLTFYIPKYKMQGSFCYHTHPDYGYPSPSHEPEGGDYGFFNYMDVENGCISNYYGDTYCFKKSARGVHKPVKFSRKGQCEVNLDIEPLLRPGKYLKLGPFAKRKRITPSMTHKYTGKFAKGGRRAVRKRKR